MRKRIKSGKTLALIISMMMCLSIFAVNINSVVYADENEAVKNDKMLREIEDNTTQKNGTAEKPVQDVVGEKTDSKDAIENKKEETDNSAEVQPEKDQIKADSNETAVKEAVAEEKKTADAKSAVQSKDKQAGKKAAAKTRAVHNDVITNITALLQDGSGPVGDIGEWQVFRLKADFELPNDTVHAGDTTIITLPDKLKFNQTASFEIKDSTGNVVANAVINGGAKTITLIYTDYTENHSDISGNFYFYVQIDRDKVDEEEIIPLEIDVSGKTVIGDPLHFTGIGTPEGHYLSKAGWQQVDSNRAIRYQLQVNTKGEKMNNVTITDKLANAGFTIDRSSIVIMKGNWAAVHGDWNLQNQTDVTGAYDISWNDDGSFTINLGDIAAEDGFVIRYTAVAEYDLVDGEVIKNDATIRGDNISVHTASANATYFEAGGSAEGYVFKIKVKKQNPEGDALAGAKFDVIRVSSSVKVGEIVTNAEGEGELGGLLKDKYKLVETEAPTGYVIDGSGETIVSANEFDETTKLVTKTVINKKGTISVPVTKVWEGPKKDFAEIELYADGKLADTVKLSPANNWQHTFTDLEKYNEGKEIAYNVKEKEITGYKSEITGDATAGYTVKNVNVETRNVKVSKKWKGDPLDSITVRLYADGEEKESVNITKDMNWQHVFKDLPKYDKDGREIKYDVKEDPVQGYSANISGDAESEFVITNEQETVPPIEEKTTPKEKTKKEIKETTKKTKVKTNNQVKSSAVKTKNTKTGDESELEKYFVAMILSGLAAVLLMMRRRKE